MRQLGDLTAVTTNPTTNQTNWFTGVLQNITQAGASYLSLKQQSDLIKMNNQRLASGLAPLNSDDYAAQVRFGLDPTTRYMVIGGIGVLALVLLTRGRRR